MSEERAPKPPMLDDNCIVCGAHMKVHHRVWESMKSMWGRNYTAPRCGNCERGRPLRPEFVANRIHLRQRRLRRAGMELRG